MFSNIPKPPKFQLNTLLTHFQNKQYENAEHLAISITSKYPNHQYAWKILAAVYEQTDRINKALDANLKALEIDPNDYEVYLCLGNNLSHLGNLEDSVSNYKKAINLKADYIQAYYNLGLILNKMKRFDESIYSFQQAINLKPDNANFYNALGLTFMELSKPEEAINYFKKAITIKQNYSQAFFNLGIALIKLGQTAKALDNFKQAIFLKPDYTRAFNSCGIALIELGRNEDALENFKQAIALDKNYTEAYMNLGNALKELGRFEESIKNYRKAIELKPDYAEGHNNYGRALLLKNDFEEAFIQMEWRLSLDELNFIPFDSEKPRWIKNKNHRVFVWKEQGIGDFIMYSSMISELYENVDKVIVECDQRLVPLLKRSLPKDIRLVTDRLEIRHSDYDSQIPIGSLPLHYRKKLNNFYRSANGWLKADKEKSQNIRKNIIKKTSKKIIGLSWKTSSMLRNSDLRNIELKSLLNPLKNLDCVFVNLQYGDVSTEISSLKLDFGIEIFEVAGIDLYKDIDGLASLISACDSVITIDNFTSHLAGALSTDTRLLLPQVADERWGLDLDKCYLYENIILYRQSIYKRWEDPILKLKKDLELIF